MTPSTVDHNNPMIPHRCDICAYGKFVNAMNYANEVAFRQASHIGVRRATTLVDNLNAIGARWKEALC